MRRIQRILNHGIVFAVLTTPLSRAAVLQRSDVVFMYRGSRELYTNYGATVLAWGGRPVTNSVEQSLGVKCFGSVGMVTEFSRYHERFPETYQEGLCRDINGQPVKVPWLTDHQHKGIPYWWCCTQQPIFRQYLRERVIETVKAGADGVHIDDHLGTAGGLWLGLCFCERCVEGFRVHLKSLPAGERTAGVSTGALDNFDFLMTVREWLAADVSKKRRPAQHPLWAEWTIYQCRAAAAFMQELHELANQTAGHRVPMGANAGLLWPRHLSDYQTLDLFSAETDHHASARRLSDAPLFAYRLADAVGRPYAATASGGDWAFIKEHNLPGLVRGWIALSYAAGHCLMAPHRQWCYTPQKGTHWYQGPTEKFAPLYQFVRRHATLFDGYENFADLAVIVPHRAFLKNPHRWFDLCNQLAAQNLSYRVLLAGDEIVDHPLRIDRLTPARTFLIPDRSELLPADRQLLEQHTRNQRVFSTAGEVLAAVRPAVQVKATGPVRVLTRRKAGSAVIHLLNYDYDSASDEVRPMEGVEVTLDTLALGIPANAACRLVRPDAPEVWLKLNDGRVAIPTLGLWGMVVLQVPP